MRVVAAAVGMIFMASACTGSSAVVLSPTAAPDSCAGIGAAPQGDGATWSQLRPSRSPAPRGSAAIAFDGKNGQLVLFGGRSGERVFNDTWTWDGGTWTEQHSAAAPPPRERAGFAADPSGRLILFGGYGPGSGANAQLGDTWSWDGHAWTEQHPTQSPPAGGDVRMFSVGSRGVLLYGGVNWSTHELSASTWLWNGHDWTSVRTERHPPTGFGAAAVDRDGSILYQAGGSPAEPTVNETWRWDGQDWSELHPAAAPPARQDTGLTFIDRGTALLFGGTKTSTTLNDTWIWTSGEWTQLAPGRSPIARASQAMAFDPVRHQLVLFGGTTLSADFVETPLCDTWTWRP